MRMNSAKFGLAPGMGVVEQMAESPRKYLPNIGYIFIFQFPKFRRSVS
jgi:hypothetical protein